MGIIELSSPAAIVPYLPSHRLDCSLCCLVLTRSTLGLHLLTYSSIY